MSQKKIKTKQNLRAVAGKVSGAISQLDTLMKSLDSAGSANYPNIFQDHENRIAALEAAVKSLLAAQVVHRVTYGPMGEDLD